MFECTVIAGECFLEVTTIEIDPSSLGVIRCIKQLEGLLKAFRSEFFLIQ
jgi:hypothetical protein